MTLTEMAIELRRTAVGNVGEIGFRQHRTPPRAVATLLAKVLRKQRGPLLTTSGCYRAEEREQFVDALESGRLDAVIAVILSEEPAEQSTP